MNGQVHHFPSTGGSRSRDVRDRLEGIVAIFDQLETQELLAALPACPIARQNHLLALRLLTEAETELRDLLGETRKSFAKSP